ncbi:2-dehydropantoate 2-reductase N-terminal domain-containing protein [Sorangium sp. So ce367]|uniref:ketopantoate reductase family protein n=1 Tax=Sorangium sp. So ce367 TaxID=3133305 RepID=UPI003F5DF4D2
MRIAIIGPGAIGSTFAHALARAGHDVTVIARGQRLAWPQGDVHVQHLRVDRPAAGGRGRRALRLRLPRRGVRAAHRWSGAPAGHRRPGPAAATRVLHEAIGRLLGLPVAPEG